MSAGRQQAGRGVTMRDVADRAGVGLATVSRVVNGAPGVSPERVRKVREAARELGYRHDATASSLRRADRRTNTVALVLEDVANPFSSALHRAITDASAERGILVLSGSSDEDPTRERELVGAARPRGRAPAVRTARRLRGAGAALGGADPVRGARVRGDRGTGGVSRSGRPVPSMLCLVCNEG